jgi:hypothetical protein
MPRGPQVQICRMRELPRPFENDDEDAAAAAIAIAILNESVAEAKTRAAQDEAIHRVKGFLEHERAKRRARK